MQRPSFKEHRDTAEGSSQRSEQLDRLVDVQTSAEEPTEKRADYGGSVQE